MDIFKMAIQNLTNTHDGHQLSSAKEDLENLSCPEAFRLIMSNDSFFEEQTRIYVTSGVQVNDLGLFDACLDNVNLLYVTVIVK